LDTGVEAGIEAASMRASSSSPVMLMMMYDLSVVAAVVICLQEGMVLVCNML
jgi:hypothetical protein